MVAPLARETPSFEPEIVVTALLWRRGRISEEELKRMISEACRIGILSTCNIEEILKKTLRRVEQHITYLIHRGIVYHDGREYVMDRDRMPGILASALERVANTIESVLKKMQEEKQPR